MLEYHFTKGCWEDKEEDLESWKVAMRFVSRKHMESTKTKDEFLIKFNGFLTHHNLKRAVVVGNKLKKGLPVN